MRKRNSMKINQQKQKDNKFINIKQKSRGNGTKKRRNAKEYYLIHNQLNIPSSFVAEDGCK